MHMGTRHRVARKTHILAPILSIEYVAGIARDFVCDVTGYLVVGALQN